MFFLTFSTRLLDTLRIDVPTGWIECYRLLVARLEQEGPDWNYPIHLGVTEAGEGEDGRIKSAIGIGSLLCDGLGDTIRVSLTEDSPREIEVCRDLLAQIPKLTTSDFRLQTSDFPFDPFHFERRATPEIELNEQRQMRRRTAHPGRCHPRNLGQGRAEDSAQGRCETGSRL